MYVTREELVKTRISIAKQMNKYIIDMGDEELWMDWIVLGVPDAPTEEDYEFIAEHDICWAELCKLFGSLVKDECAEGAD
jgi:hypothetical protein